MREKYCSRTAGASSKLAFDNPFLIEKVQLRESPTLPSLMIVADNRCLDKNSERGSLSRLLLEQSEMISELDKQAYAFSPPVEWGIGELKSAAAKDPCVLGVEENRRINSMSIQAQFNDTLKTDLRHLDAINAAAAYEVLYGPDGIAKESADRDVHVAVVDSGVDVNHPDLQQNIWTFTLDGEPNRYYSGINIASLKDSVINYNPVDLQGHGTAMAGIIGADANNGIGVIGVMPYRVKLMAIKAAEENPDVPGTEVIYTHTIINGVRWAAARGADVINLSNGEETLGPNGNLSFSLAVEEVIQAGVVVVAAAGNRTGPSRELNGSSLTVIPAIFGEMYEGMITVGASNADSKDLLFSSVFSSKYVEIAAPGSQLNSGEMENGILTTVPKALVNQRSNYISQEGTSVSAAIVSAAAGLVVGWVREKTGQVPLPCVVEGVIKESAEKRSDLAEFIQEGRHLDLYQMTKLLQEFWP